MRSQSVSASWLRLHAFLALVLGAYAVALLTPATALRSYADGRVEKGELTAKAAAKFPEKPASSRVAWMNDAGFWIISKSTGLTERDTLRTVTPMMALQGFAGLAFTMLCAWLWPMV